MALLARPVGERLEQLYQLHAQAVNAGDASMILELQGMIGSLYLTAGTKFIVSAAKSPIPELGVEEEIPAYKPSAHTKLCPMCKKRACARRARSCHKCFAIRQTKAYKQQIGKAA